MEIKILTSGRTDSLQIEDGSLTRVVSFLFLLRLNGNAGIVDFYVDILTLASFHLSMVFREAKWNNFLGIARDTVSQFAALCEIESTSFKIFSRRKNLDSNWMEIARRVSHLFFWNISKIYLLCYLFDYNRRNIETELLSSTKNCTHL